MFDGRAWLAKNVAQAHGVTDAAWKSVSDFSLLWSLFELKLCGTNANADVMKKVAGDFAGSPLPQVLTDAFAYWQNRYVAAGETNNRFEELFTKPPGKDFAAATLKAAAPNDDAKLKCILLITYRLRNNLFHGVKEIETFNDQIDNLNFGSAALATVMGWAGIH